MIGKKVTFFLLCMFFVSSSLVKADSLALKSGTTVVPDDETYYKQSLTNSNVELIYTKKNTPYAKHTADIEESLHADYKKFFQWKLDETLYVGLMSEQNQIANAFSTQWPNNRQINYMGGSSELDYFANTSWLDILLYHETAHNYQTNVKKSIVSQTLHAYLGNGTLFLPTYFTVPGSGANSFMLEGNAVLNESRHGYGGRLYSGRFKAMTYLQAKSGNITPQYMYNHRLKFPYTGDIFYQIGGFYNLYMAKKYGLQNINSYFLEKTAEWWWPFFTNDAMQRAVGINFEESLKDFANIYAKEAASLVLAKGKRVASSQFYKALSSTKDEIFFIINENASATPELVIINKKDKSITKRRDSFIASKVIKIDEKYYTQASKNTSVRTILQGLYDSNAMIKKGTESKMIQGYLRDGRAVYFDVKSSFKVPQLYIGKKYYTWTNSSVFIDTKDNIYYFKNDKKKRTLYKNKIPLYTYEGFYGIVCDVDKEGAVYFVANSKLGSTLYRYKNENITRANKADNILDARLFDDGSLLLSAVGESDYYYVESKLETLPTQVYETKLFFEDKNYYTQHNDGNISHETKNIKKYSAYKEMHYSGSDVNFGASSDGSFIGSININFADPLTQNSLSIFASKDEYNTTIAGLSYANSKNILQYGVDIYKLVQKSKLVKSRNYGIMASLSLPLYRQGYYNALATLVYFQDYNTLKREPLSSTLVFSREEQYGISMYKNYENAMSAYYVRERKDNIYGASYNFMQEMGSEFYFQMSAKFSKTDADITQSRANTQTRGVKISPIFYQIDKDSSTIIMPTIENYIYIKSAGYAEVGVAKVFNFSSYFFTFPLSLQRESLYFKYRYYNIETFYANYNEKVNEYMGGVRLDTVFLNILSPVSLSFDLYYNDNSNFTKDRVKILFNFGGTF